MSSMPEKPVQELVVALAGPAVNLGLSLLLVPPMAAWVATNVLSGRPVVWPVFTEPGLINLAAFMLMVNISLLLFNLLPAFPMDGGRVLRALIAMRWSHRTATRVAVFVGRVFAVAFGALAIYTANIFMGLVAVFVFNGAGVEGREEEPSPVPAPLDVPASRPPVLLSNMPAYLAFDRLMRSPYAALAVVDDRGDFVGLVTRAGMQSRWAEGVRGPVSLFIEPAIGFPRVPAPVE